MPSVIPRWLPVIACGLLPAPPLAAFEVLSGTLAFDCRQATPSRLECEYLPTAGGVAARPRLQVADVEIAPSRTSEYPGPGATTAILFSIDTSDPARTETVARNVEQLGAMLEQREPHHRLGLARFDSAFHLLEPIGSSPNEILDAAAGLTAVGPTTELFRGAIEAIRTLAEVDADRRLLVIFSDGLAEDFAYDAADVVNAAREAGVMIMTLGYARSVPQSVALQTLQRLSEETAGPHLRAGPGGDLPVDFLAAPFAAIEGGGVLEFDLEGVIPPGTTARADVVLRVAERTRRIPLRLEGPPATAAAPTVEAATTAPGAGDEAAAEILDTVVTPAGSAQEARPAPETRAAAAGAGSNAVPTWLWFGTPAAFLAVVVVALALYGVALRKRSPGGGGESDSPKPFAYFVRQDDSEARYVVARSPWRIGRSKNNELTLDDHSVSRQHAEVSRNPNGSFTIRDLDSLNGVFVNERKVAESELTEGDAVEIGDVGLRFTIYDADPAAQEPTVMIKTHTPPAHS